MSDARDIPEIPLMAVRSRGRPPGFDREAALRRAVVVFWENGYAQTSLDQLLEGMEIARSSFYASFGSKHKLMLAALDLYTHELYERMQHAAGSGADARKALASVLDVAACTVKPAHGCLLVNMTIELSPADPLVRARAKAHMKRVNRLVAGLLRSTGLSLNEARERSGLLLALATGAVSLRKSGQSQRRIRQVLDLTFALVTTSR